VAKERKEKVIVNFPWRRRGERRELKEGKEHEGLMFRSTPAEGVKLSAFS